MSAPQSLFGMTKCDITNTHAVANNKTEHSTEHSKECLRERDILDHSTNQANDGGPDRETKDILPALKQCSGKKEMN